jgi:hypothetical protein
MSNDPLGLTPQQRAWSEACEAIEKDPMYFNPDYWPSTFRQSVLQYRAIERLRFSVQDPKPTLTVSVS